MPDLEKEKQEVVADEVVEEEKVEEPENDDSDEEEKDPEFTDSKEEKDSETKEETTDENKQEHKGGKSSFFAQMRREREAKEKANNKETKVEDTKENLYLKGVIAGTGGKNPYTGQEIKDELDLKEFQLMQELSNQGKDPVKDYLEALKSREREAALEKQKQVEEEKDRQNRFNQEFDEFVSKYGQDKLTELSKDPEFTQFADMYIGDVPITKIYERFKGNKDYIEKKAEELAIKKAARMKSSSGGVGKKENFDEKPDFSKMTNEEFKEYDKRREELRKASRR